MDMSTLFRLFLFLNLIFLKSTTTAILLTSETLEESKFHHIHSHYIANSYFIHNYDPRVIIQLGQNLHPVTILPAQPLNLSSTQSISLKQSDQLKFSPVSRPVFYVFPAHLQELIFAIVNSGYAHMESAVFIAQIEPERQDAFIQSSYTDNLNLFSGFHATLIVETVQNDGFNWAFYCHLCPPLAKFAFLNPMPTNLPTFSTQLTQLTRQLNWNAHGSPAYVSSLYSLAPTHCARCIQELYFEKFDCDDFCILFTILGQKMNFTLSFSAASSEPGLRISTEIEKHDKLPFYGTILYTNDARELAAVYCEHSLNFVIPTWDFLLKPFDKFIWIAIILTAVTFGLTFRSFGHGLDIFWLLIGQPLQNKFTIGLSCLAILLIVLSNGYLGVITSTIITALQEKTYDYMKDLLDADYRLVHDKVETVFYMRLAMRDTMAKYNHSVEKVCCLIHEDARIGYAPPRFMADNKGFVVRLRDAETEERMLGEKVARSTMTIGCHMVKERIPVEHVVIWGFWSHLSERAYALMLSLTESGIARLWYRFSLRHRTSKEILFETRNGAQGQFVGPKKLKLFGSHLEIIFGLYLIGIGGCCVGFLAELAMSYYKSKGKEIIVRIYMIGLLNIYAIIANVKRGLIGNQ